MIQRRKNAGGVRQDKKERHLLWALTAHTRRLKRARLCNWDGRGQVFLKLFVVIWCLAHQDQGDALSMVVEVVVAHLVSKHKGGLGDVRREEIAVWWRRTFLSCVHLSISVFEPDQLFFPFLCIFCVWADQPVFMFCIWTWTCVYLCVCDPVFEPDQREGGPPWLGGRSDDRGSLRWKSSPCECCVEFLCLLK